MFQSDEEAFPVQGNLEQKTAFNVNLHFDVKLTEEESTLKTGHVVWLCFSEKPYYIQGESPADSVEKTIEWMIGQQLKSSATVQDETEPEELVRVPLTPDHLEAHGEGLREDRDREQPDQRVPFQRAPEPAET
jgi:hypothetical protein